MAVLAEGMARRPPVRQTASITASATFVSMSSEQLRDSASLLVAIGELPCHS